jgi:phosphoserine phosphatase
LRERVALLEGAPMSEVNALLGRLTINPGAASLVATMRAHGALTALVSGGFTLFTEPVARRLRFDRNYGNHLGVVGEKLDGTVAEPILGRDAKSRTLAMIAAERSIATSDTVSVGDGANDVEMIKLAGLGVAYHAKPVLENAAAVSIRHADLTALLYLQGYRHEQIMESVG